MGCFRNQAVYFLHKPKHSCNSRGENRQVNWWRKTRVCVNKTHLIAFQFLLWFTFEYLSVWKPNGLEFYGIFTLSDSFYRNGFWTEFLRKVCKVFWYARLGSGLEREETHKKWQVSFSVDWGEKISGISPVASKPYVEDLALLFSDDTFCVLWVLSVVIFFKHFVRPWGQTGPLTPDMFCVLLSGLGPFSDYLVSIFLGVAGGNLLQLLHLDVVLPGRHAGVDPRHRPCDAGAHGHHRRRVPQRRRQHLHRPGVCF